MVGTFKKENVGDFIILSVFHLYLFKQSLTHLIFWKMNHFYFFLTVSLAVCKLQTELENTTKIGMSLYRAALGNFVRLHKGAVLELKLSEK